jgi:DNA polymerase-3 subunit beta
MKVKSSELNAALSLVAPVSAGAGKIMTILGCTKLDVIDNKLNIVASNLEMQISTSCNVEGDILSGCIDADKISKFTKASGNDVIVDITIGSDNKAVLKGKSRSTVNVLPANDFPEMKVDFNKSITVKMSASDLAFAFDNVSHCVAINDVRYYLNGINFKLSNGELTIVGSDGFRLSTVTIPVNCSESIECIIPLKTAQTIAKVFKNGDIDLVLSKNSLSVTDGETTIIGKNIDAKYPDFSRQFNIERPNHIIVNRADFVSGIESVLLTATDLVKKITITFSKDNIHFESSNSQGEKSEADISCDFSGKEFVFGANSDYVLASAKKIDGNIHIHFADDCSNFIMTEDSEAGATHLLMPIRV